MSWCCPHEDKEFCKKRHKECKPLSRGCVLEGKGLKIIANYNSSGATSQRHDGFKKGGKRDDANTREKAEL